MNPVAPAPTCSSFELPHPSSHWPSRHGLTVVGLCRLIKDIVEGPPRKLVEAVAEDIATNILDKHALIQGVRVHICKPHVAIEGVVDSLGKFWYD